jgi:hypothetical protein
LANITITVIDDGIDENDETVIVTMGVPTNATAGATDVHTATITDNDGQPEVNWTVAIQSGAENVGTMTVTAQLSDVSGLDVTVPFSVSGTALDPAGVPEVNWTAASQSGAENVGTMTVTAQLSSISGLDVTVPFGVGGTASDRRWRYGI